MSTFLYVDYGAMEFEKEYNPQAVYENMRTKGVKADVYYLETFEDNVVVKILEFGEVDNDFITFMFNNFVDYDDSKERNIYRVY